MSNNDSKEEEGSDCHTIWDKINAVDDVITKVCIKTTYPRYSLIIRCFFN